MSEPEEPVIPGENVKTGNVTNTLINEIVSMAEELKARRRFDEDVTEWIRGLGLTVAFEDWRKQKMNERAADRANDAMH
jgi:hypothetical protein